MTTILNRLLLPENLYWAWRKAHRLYSQVEGIFDQLDVSAFELELEKNLKGIHRDFQDGTYRLRPMRLLPQPKRPDDDGTPRMRQSFKIAVRDQVAWIAFVNAIGPELDLKMQPWSYGHRLYRAAWYEDFEDEKSSILCIGPYRHAAGHLYRHFKHSWPRFRRHIVLTARFMGGANSLFRYQLEEGERRAFDEQRRAQEELADDRLPYLEQAYWRSSRGEESKVYHIGFDLKKFYPNLSTSLIVKNVLNSAKNIEQEPRVVSLLNNLLDFTVSTRGLSEDLMAASDPPVKPGRFRGIPTGLMCSGFLSNVAMMHVDRIAADEANKNEIAHFRFVDDHVALGFDFDNLCEWIGRYEEILKNANIQALVNRSKFQPKEVTASVCGVLKRLDGEKSIASVSEGSDRELALEASKVDPMNPAPLMTGTLAQISTLAGMNFDVLTDSERRGCLAQLQQLIVGNISELEVREDTRVAFAAGRIATLAPRALEAPFDLANLRRKDGGTGQGVEFEEELKILENTFEEASERHISKYFNILMRAFRTHPEKIRIFHHVLNYCMNTGIDGHGEIRDWLQTEGRALSGPLSRYLGAVGVAVVSRQCLYAVRRYFDDSSLESQKAVSLRFLRNVAKADFEGFLYDDVDGGSFFESDAGILANVASSAAGELLRRSSGDSEVQALGARLDKLANRFCASIWGLESGSWRGVSGRSLGVWLHWLESTVQGPWETRPSAIWEAASEKLDFRYRADCTEVRRYPSYLPDSTWESIVKGEFPLARDDAGWLLDVIGESEKRAASLPEEGRYSRLFNSVRVASESALAARAVSLLSWVGAMGVHAKEAPHDPRTGEWTALEIVRQVTERIQAAGVGTLSDLDSLHPANVTVPVKWLGLDDVEEPGRAWTWENWRRYAGKGRTSVGLQRRRIRDFRYGVEGFTFGSATWERRLTAIGMLLFGLLRLDFSYPSPWNIRGQHRSRVELVRRELEQLRVSSWTLSILESCLYARSRENLLLPYFRELFQSDVSDVRDDTIWDPPKIPELDRLHQLISEAQRGLESRQIAVLDHAPRQLVPISITQLKGGFWFADDADGGQA